MRDLCILTVLCLSLCGAARAQEDRLIVFAAASLTEALNDVGAAYAATGRPKPALSFASSAALARQIENGAPVGIFISADEQWMNYLDQRQLIAPGTRTPFLGNTLVLAAPADRPLAVTIAPNFALAAVLGTGKLALADPDSVPAGRYAKAALEHLGVWGDVERNVVRAESVRAALAFVERGAAAAGIVYATDAALAKKVTVVGTFPHDTHTPISYPLAIVAAHDTPAARAFREFLLGDEAKTIYRRYGFAVR